MPTNPPSLSPGTTVTNNLMNQMKNISVNPTLTSAIQSSTVAHLDDYEITEPVSKSSSKIAAFPPRSSSTIDETTTSTHSNEPPIRFGVTSSSA